MKLYVTNCPKNQTGALQSRAFGISFLRTLSSERLLIYQFVFGWCGRLFGSRQQSAAGFDPRTSLTAYINFALLAFTFTLAIGEIVHATRSLWAVLWLTGQPRRHPSRSTYLSLSEQLNIKTLPKDWLRGETPSIV